MFKLRFEYSNIFKEIYKVDEEKDVKRLKTGEIKDEKVFKIKYQLNILPSVSEEQG
jgi:hypothetical protein